MRAALDETLDDQALAVELAGLLEFVAEFLTRAEGPRLRADFARASCGAYTLEELRADLGRFARWLTGKGLA